VAGCVVGRPRPNASMMAGPSTAGGSCCRGGRSICATGLPLNTSRLTSQLQKLDRVASRQRIVFVGAHVVHPPLDRRDGEIGRPGQPPLSSPDELQVPEATMLSLQRRRLSFMERLGYRAEGTGDSFFAMAFRDILGHLRRTQGRSLLYQLHSWVWYLQASWGVPSGSQLTVHAARRLLNRLQYSFPISPGPNMRRSNAKRDA
jgi:hypothetical protein